MLTNINIQLVNLRGEGSDSVASQIWHDFQDHVKLSGNITVTVVYVRQKLHLRHPGHLC